MATHHLVDLCNLLVEDLYGSTGAKVATVLLHVGRQTTKDICRRTGLPLTAVKRSLVSLVQARLVQFWTDPKSPAITYYSADPAKIYSLLWLGPLIASIKTNVPAEADTLVPLVKDVMVSGYRKLQDIVNPQPDSGADPSAGLIRLAQLGYLIPVHDFEFSPLEDLKESAATKKFREINSEPRGMAMTEATKKTQIEQSVKAYTESLEKTRCRERLITAASPPQLKQDLAAAINSDKFLLAARRAELVDLVSRRVGAISAKVYDQVLALSERGRPMFQRELERVPLPENTITTDEVVQAVAKLGLDLGSAFVKPEEDDTSAGSKRAVKAEAESGRGHKRMRSNVGAIAIQAAAFGQRSAKDLVTLHLRLLENANIPFLRRVGDRNGGEWFVPMESLLEHLKRITFDEVVAEHLDPIAARIVRVVRQLGRVDEKTLSQTTLLQTREVRIHTTSLEYNGFLDLQEVPRSNDRAPGRCFFLWYHRPDWAYSRLVELLYFAMVKVFKQIQELRLKHKTLLTKLMRADVTGHEDQFLTGQEKQDLAEYKQAETALRAQQLRMDRHVRVFRDY